MMQELKTKVINALFGWHWYRVTLIYKSKAGHEVFRVCRDVGVTYKKGISGHRSIKQAFGPIYLDKSLPKRLLCNGEWCLEPTCYLGRFKK